MKVIYDQDQDILNIEFLEDESIDDTIEYEEGVLVDYSKEKKIVSIEILDASKRISQNPIHSLSFIVLNESKKETLVSR